MTTRNFWIEANIDGQRTRLVGGPAAKTGGIELVVKMRDAGEIFTAARIEGFAAPNGVLTLRIASEGETTEIRTTR